MATNRYKEPGRRLYLEVVGADIVSGDPVVIGADDYGQMPGVALTDAQADDDFDSGYGATVQVEGAFWLDVTGIDGGTAIVAGMPLFAAVDGNGYVTQIDIGPGGGGDGTGTIPYGYALRPVAAGDGSDNTENIPVKIWGSTWPVIVVVPL